MNLKLKLCNERQLGMAMRIRQHAPTGGYMRIAQICGYMGNGHVKIFMRNAHAHVSGLINESKNGSKNEIYLRYMRQQIRM